MAKVVDPKSKIDHCLFCDAAVLYMPEEVEKIDGTGIIDPPMTLERIKCPVPNCSGHVYAGIRVSR